MIGRITLDAKPTGERRTGKPCAPFDRAGLETGSSPGTAPALDPTTSEARAPPKPRSWSWAAFMRRAFALDVLACPRCGARLRVVATIEDPVAVRRILNSVVCHVPPRLLARVRPLRFAPRTTELISPRGTETPRPAAEPGPESAPFRAPLPRQDAGVARGRGAA
jgi:uncharacterized protein YbaR (Trm112 family)